MILDRIVDKSIDRTQINVRYLAAKDTYVIT